MTPEQYVALRTIASQARNIERVLLGLENQIRKFTVDFGLPPEAMQWSEMHVPQLRKIRDRLMRECGRATKGSPLHGWASEVHGLGNALFFTVGLIPPLEDFKSVSAVWKYLGLHVVDGASVQRRAGSFVGFSAKLRSYALKRVAEPTVKQRQSPYRAVYDARKEYTRETHPSMFVHDAEGKQTEELLHPDCEFCQKAIRQTKASRAAKQQTRERTSVAFDCANVGGVHWKDGHRSADALRVTAKAIFRDAWRVAHRMEPKVSAESQCAPATQCMRAPALTFA
jgi:hypothetical protein